MKSKLSVALFVFFIFAVQPAFANNWGIAQDMGVKQGWMAPYNGEQLGYTGIPCQVRQPTEAEKQDIVNLLCGSEQESNFVQCKQNTVEWISAYPTCESRNIGVRKSESGLLETFDLPAQIEASATPLTEEQPTPLVEVQQNIAPNTNTLNFQWSDVIAIITILLFVGGAIYCFVQYQKIGTIEKEINSLEAEWDDVPRKFKKPVQNDLLMRIFEKERKPIERKIYLHKQKRQFILDKIPLVGWLKK